MEDVVEETVTRVIGVYMEHIDERFDIVIEGQKALAERLDRLEIQVAALEERMDRMEADIAWLKSEVREIRRELKNKVNRHEFLALEKRVTKLEQQVR